MAQLRSQMQVLIKKTAENRCLSCKHQIKSMKLKTQIKALIKKLTLIMQIAQTKIPFVLIWSKSETQEPALSALDRP